MKITYLKLKNFIGIYNGLGLKEVEFDISKGLNHVTLLVGHNGSGKSTVMSTLHPFSGTFDDKTTIILPNTMGYKEVHIDKDGTLYIIKHHYDYTKKAKSIKSFIQKQVGDELIELNENGGVRTFEEVIKSELDLVPSFMSLSRIGSNVSGFIHKKSTERKKQITEFLPDIEDFLYNYKVVNDKWSSCRKDIKSIADQINQIDSMDHLNTLEISEKQSIKHYEDLIQSERKRQTEINFRINQLDPDGSIRSRYMELGTEYNTLKLELNELSSVDFGKYNSLEIINKSMLDLENKRKSRKERLSEIEKQIEKSKVRILEIQESLNDTRDKLAANTREKNLSEYYELRTQYTEQITSLSEELENYGDFHCYDNLTNDEIAEYDTAFSDLEESIDAVLESVDISVLDSIKPEDIDQITKVNIPKLTAAVTNTKEIISKLNTSNATLLANLHQKDILDQRPKTCSDNTCPFIKEALKFANVEKELNATQLKLDIANEKLKQQEEALKLSNDIYTTYLRVNALYNGMKGDKILSIMHYFKGKDITWFITELMTKNRDKYRTTLITDVKDYVFTNNDKKMYESQLDNVNREISILEVNQTLINNLTEQIENYENQMTKETMELDNLSAEEENLKTVIQKLDHLESVLNEGHAHFTVVEEKSNRVKELTVEIKEINDTIAEIKSLNVSNKEAVALIEQYEEELKPHVSTLDKIKIDKANLEVFTAKKKALDETFNDLNIVRDALNPNKGIPLLFINTYLTKTKLIANKLLDVAFKGKFRIEEFEVTDKDFFIKLQKADGELLPDVVYASQGESALISLAISMALIQQSMRKYNILLLDEIDSELDEHNRKSFIEILESQFEMLGVEQCFLITHNNEFDSYNTNLMLFLDHGVDTQNVEYMANKTVIFEAGVTK